MKRNGIKRIKVAPYHPAPNSLAERAVRIFKESYEKMEGGSVQKKLSRFLLSYRTTPHSTTGVPLAELLMKRRLHTQLNQLIPSVANRVRNKQSQQKAAHDYHAKEREILRVRLFMLRISATRRPGCQELSWGKLVHCQLEFSWTTGQSSDDTKTMFEAVRTIWQESQRQV